MPNEETIDKIHYSFNDIKFSLYIEKSKKKQGIATSSFIERNYNVLVKEVKSPKPLNTNGEEDKELVEIYKKEAFRTFFETGDEYIKITAGGRYNSIEIEYNFVTGQTKYSSTFESPIRDKAIESLASQKLIQPKKLPYRLQKIIKENNILLTQLKKDAETKQSNNTEEASGDEEKGSQRKRCKDTNNKN